MEVPDVVDKDALSYTLSEPNLCTTMGQCKQPLLVIEQAKGLQEGALRGG